MTGAPPASKLEEAAKEAIGRLRGRPGLVVLEELPEPLVVVGDVHGDYETLSRILGDREVEEALDRGLVVFLGDYVDRGPQQVQVVYELLELLTGGARVLLLRGNHEPPAGLEPVPHDFPYRLAELYGPGRAAELYELFRALFDELPYAALVRDHMLLVHGGPPDWVVEDEYGSLEEALRPGRRSTLELLEQVLWNDPADDVEYSAPSPRGAGVLWGWRVTEAVKRKGGVRYVVRGHEPCDGVKLDHGGSVVTVFSRRGPPYFNRRAAYLVVNRDCARDLPSCARFIE